MSAKAVRALITGRVQGVGFRYWVRCEAEARGLAGWVRNLPDGRVEAVFAGRADKVDDMLAACWGGPVFSGVRAVDSAPCTEALPKGFEIRR